MSKRGASTPLLPTTQYYPMNNIEQNNGSPTINGISSSQSSTGRRFLDRGGRFYQSVGRSNIRRQGGDWRGIYADDLFHTIINTRTSRILVGIFSAYFVVIFLFALAYLHVSYQYPSCNMGLNSVIDAYMFSLETIMTIGYGASGNDIFFGSCYSVATLLTLQSYAGIFLDSLCIGIFFARFARAQKRASTIIFSKCGVIRQIRGNFYFMFQVCERRKHQLVEAHVRLYALRYDWARSPIEEGVHQCHQMRVQQPDDDVGAMLLLALPQTVVHRIDPWSPLFPPECLPSNEHYPAMAGLYPEPTQRMVDIDNGNRDAGVFAGKEPPTKKPTKQMIIDHIRRSELEVIVILEGIDGSTSATMQARHSYIGDDIAFDATFKNCVSQEKDGAFLIDFDAFHLLKPVPENVDYCKSTSVF